MQAAEPPQVPWQPSQSILKDNRVESPQQMQAVNSRHVSFEALDKGPPVLPAPAASATDAQEILSLKDQLRQELAALNAEIENMQ